MIIQGREKTFAHLKKWFDFSNNQSHSIIGQYFPLNYQDYGILQITAALILMAQNVQTSKPTFSFLPQNTAF